jgi:hypothetical protein
MIVLALPPRSNVLAAAVNAARRGALRTVHLDAQTVAALQSFEVAAPIVVVGCEHSLDLIRGRNDVIFVSEGAIP